MGEWTMLTVLKRGFFTTVQDQGRYGYQKDGVVVSGVLDDYAHRIANYLVGNCENSPTLEITLNGPQLQFHIDAIIAICGGNLSPSINGRPLPMWKSILIKKDTVISFGKCLAGARSYLAVSGGFHVPKVMKSASTYVRGKFGGVDGRTLQLNDKLTFGPIRKLNKRIFEKLTESTVANWSVPYQCIYSNKLIRVMKGRQYEKFTDISRTNFFKSPYTITTESDRMGYRLKGIPLALQRDEEMLSEAVTFGTIQITTDGHPIILLADRQTTGGYPKIAQVASVDFPSLAQMKPGDRIDFEFITIEKAQQLLRQRERYLQLMKTGICLKYS